ncbi:MAG TPA: type II toxin-antitoxin system PemK/MazF family toxin [Anaerolineaceae bacterium]|nr:type II toxin-antitoxin system PemK/MazF family toxin [Anaerolineaceae bacterium]
MQRGDVILVDLDSPISQVGHVQTGRRYAVVISNDQIIPSISVITVVPLTSKDSALRRYPNTIEISPNVYNGLQEKSYALIVQVQTIDRLRILELSGHLEQEVLNKIDQKLIEYLIRNS